MWTGFFGFSENIFAMKVKLFVLLVVVLFGVALGETIHFTNSAKHLKSTKNFTTYEVEVPGSRPITIIEANPEESNRQSSGQQKPQIPQIIRYRNAGGGNVDEHAHEVVDDGRKGSSQVKKTLYSPDLLNKFLKEYSEKLKNADQVTRQKLNEISLINTGNGNVEKVEPVNGNQGKEDQLHHTDIHERHSGNSKWSGDNGKTTHPWNIKDGWVTMEAVPWSESKVSKWHSNSNKFNGNRHQNEYHSSNQWTSNESEETMSRPKPMQTSNNYYGNDDYVDYGDSSSSYQTPNRPTSYTSEKPSRPTFESLYNRRYKPSEDYYNRKSSMYNPDYHGGGVGDTWYDHGFKKPTPQSADIITDGRKPHFPQYPATSTRPQQPTTDRNHPQSYPEHGNGEWVLISTTKGYQYPRRKGQRAITFSPQPTSLAHKSVKLTVLPMKNSLDMTTSHNGLIEVSASTQTVEQSFKQQQQQQQPDQQPQTNNKLDKTPIRKKRVSAPKFTLMRQDNSVQDSSSVLAAVGAGLVPATLAVLAPMVLGRKRRSAEAHPEQLLPARL